MKSYLKYSILITLTLLMTIGLANAQPVPIGTTPQTNPWESNPTAYAATPGITVNTPAQMYDGRLTLEGSFTIGDLDSDAWVEVNTFDAPATQFAITWVDLKVNFKVDAGLIDDTWRLEWTVGANPWNVLMPDQTAMFDSAGTAQTTVWSQRIEPTNGAWDWTDISNLKVRFYTTAGEDMLSDYVLLHVTEVWADVYSSPVPLAGMSIQPPNVYVGATPASKRFFVDIYVEGAVKMAGYQVRMYYNTTKINTIASGSIWSYYPFNDQANPDILDDANGFVEIAYTIPIANPLSGTGVSGNFPIARIYLITTAAMLTSDYSWLRLTVSFMGDNQATKLAHNVYHGSYGTIPAGKYLAGSDPYDLLPTPIEFPYADPISTHWVEQFPNLGSQWHLTSFTDNGDLSLNPSDQIDMTPTTPPGPVKWFHVDQIWECDTAADKYVYMILTAKEGPIPEFPLGIGILMAIAPMIAIIYVWRLRKKVGDLQ